MTLTCVKRKEETMSHLIAKNIMINMVAELIAEKYKLSLKEARIELYRSEIISLLDDDETGLYGESPLYVFSLYEYYKAKPVFIWDLDGTLIDSYDIIVDSLCRIYKEKIGIDLNREDVYKEAIRYSVGHFIQGMEKQTGIKFDELKDRYSQISGEEKLKIKPMKHALEILEYLKEQGIHSYVFTHRGKSTEPVLRNIRIYDYFDEIITSVDPAFNRKPLPDSINYLVDKYHLDRKNTYYVGDRSMDIECANNAHIKSIMYLPKDGYGLATGKETYIIEDLLDIKDIIKKAR